METREHSPELIEHAPELTPPPIELLLDTQRAREAWPESVVHHEAFLAQVQEREEFNQRLAMVLDRLPRPDMPLPEAIAQGHLTEEVVADLYTSLSAFIGNTEYSHALLYLPFEFLPPSTWRPASEQLQHAVEQFRTQYLATWHTLLTLQSVRANFVDGDVLEVEARTHDLPRVVKAIHLIPWLVQLEYLTAEQVVRLQQTSNNEILSQSIADTLPVLADMGFLPSLPEETTEQNIPPMPLESLMDILKDEFARIDTEATAQDIPKKRQAWLKSESRRKAITSAGDGIAKAITAAIITPEDFEKIGASSTDTLSQQACVEGIRKAIESTAIIDTARAADLYARHQQFLHALWEQPIPAIHEALTKTFYRLHALALVSDETLDALHLVMPALAGPFSKNEGLFEQELHEVRDVILSLESNPELAPYVYPVALLYGSRLKGYGAADADIDVGVIVRPDTPTTKQAELRAALNKAFTQKKLDGNVVEFWLTETADGLAVQDPTSPDALRGESYWTHILFGAAWYGNTEIIKELREKLLVPYFSDTSKRIHHRAARALYLEELERDTLQYRLMHKGYERFYPSVGGIRTPHANHIDGESAFWDSGYRHMAIKLFGNRVFLPKLPQE